MDNRKQRHRRAAATKAVARYRRLTPPERLEARELLATVAFHWSAAEQLAPQVAAQADLAAPASLAISDAVIARYSALAPAPVYGPAPLATGLQGNGAAASGSPPSVYAAGAVADRFLDLHKQTLGVQDVAGELQPTGVESDDLGMTHLRYQQMYQGIPVFGSEALVHLAPDTTVNSANGRLVSDIALDSTPQLSQDEAIALARAVFDTSLTADGTALIPDGNVSASFVPEVTYVQLYVLNQSLLDNTQEPVSHLTWEVHLVQQDLGVNESYFIDAHTGELLEQLDGNRHLTRIVGDCSTGDGLCGVNRYSSTYGYTFGRSEGKPPVGPNPVMGSSTDTDSVYDLLGFIHNDVLLARLGRNGGNGRGGIGDGSNFQWTSTAVYVHMEKVDLRYCQEQGAGFNVYQLDFCSGYAVPDIIAHEYAHSIPYYSRFDAQGRPVPMVYQGESGALDENFADAFGEAVEY